MAAVARRTLRDAHDIAALLHERVQLADVGQGRDLPHLIAGLFPEVMGEMPADYRVALDARKDLVETRTRALAADAVRRLEPWVRRLGEPPTGTTEREGLEATDRHARRLPRSVQSRRPASARRTSTPVTNEWVRR
jgi:hypothetical protein